MKTLSAFRFPLSAFAALLAVCSAVATPVLFSVQSLTGAASNRSILVQPDRVDNPLVLGTNLVPARDFTMQPVNGVVTTNLQPWGYTIRVDGWPRSAHITVPNSTNTINVATLINTNAFSPVTIQMLGDNAVGTNVNLSGTFSMTNLSIFCPWPGGSVSRKIFEAGDAEALNTFGTYMVLNQRDNGGSPDGFHVVVHGQSELILGADGTDEECYFFNSLTGIKLSGGTIMFGVNGVDEGVSQTAELLADGTFRAGAFSGNGSGLTNVLASSLRAGAVSGFTGIVTNWASGMGNNSNRIYFASGIVTNVTRP